MAEYTYKAMGARLAGGLREAHIEQRDAARELDVTPETVNNWVSGRTRIPIDKAALLCDMLGWPLDRLAVRDFDPTTDSEVI